MIKIISCIKSQKAYLYKDKMRTALTKLTFPPNNKSHENLVTSDQ